MRVLYEINDVYPTGKGSSRRTIHLTERSLFNSDIKIEVFCREKSSSEPLNGSQSHITRVNPKKVRLQQLDDKFISFQKLPYPVNDYLIYRNLFQDFLQNECYNLPDIIHCRSSWGGVVASKFRDQCKFIYEANGLSSIELPYIHPEYATTYKRLLHRIRKEEFETALHADRIVVVSNVTKEYFVKHGIPESKFVTIPNGVDFSKFYPQSISFERKSMLLNSKMVKIQQDDIILGFVGSFQPWQGLKSLVKILPELVREVPNIKLVLVGKHKYAWRKELRKITKDGDVRKHLIILKQINDLDRMAEIINCFDIAIAPFENTPRNTIMGFNPLKIYEYLACGKPVITTDLPAVREISDDNLLYFTKSPNQQNFTSEVINAITRIQSKPNDPKNLINRLNINKSGWNARVSSLERLYLEVLGDNDE